MGRSGSTSSKPSVSRGLPRADSGCQEVSGDGSKRVVPCEGTGGCCGIRARASPRRNGSRRIVLRRLRVGRAATGAAGCGTERTGSAGLGRTREDKTGTAGRARVSWSKELRVPGLRSLGNVRDRRGSLKAGENDSRRPALNGGHGRASAARTAARASAASISL